MSRFRQARGEAAERAAERRRREDSAPRLIEQVPKLESLRLELHEKRGTAVVVESVHVKRVPVAHAAALFELPCLDPTCKEGGHDVTAAILRQLQGGASSFQGEDQCLGKSGTAECQRVLCYVGTATYRSGG